MKPSFDMTEQQNAAPKRPESSHAQSPLQHQPSLPRQPNRVTGQRLLRQALLLVLLAAQAALAQTPPKRSAAELMDAIMWNREP